MSKLALVAFAVVCTRIVVRSGDDCQTIDDHCVGGYASLLQESVKLMAQRIDTATQFIQAPGYQDHVLTSPKIPTDAAHQFAPDPDELCKPQTLVNPSILAMPQLNEVWVVQRSLKKCVAHGGGTSWFNNVVFARAALSNLGMNANASWAWKNYTVVHDPRLEGGNMTACLDPIWMFGGAYSEGLEDPKLFNYNGKSFIMVIGCEAVQSPPYGTIIPHAHQPNISSQARLRSQMRPSCTKFGPNPYIAEIESVHPTIKLGPLLHLPSPDHRWIDKNWSPFIWTPAGQEPRLMMIQNVHPHAILQVNSSTGHTQKLFSEVSPAVTDMALKANINASELHGGSGVARVENSGHQYNLAIMHVHGPWFKGDAVYRNWPYKFSTEPPFNIIAVGREIPFADGHGIKFVSSIVVHNNTVVIGYGWGDVKSRIWKMDLNGFESTFF